METVAKANFLLSEVKTQIKQSYNRWYVGTSEWSDIWRSSKGDMVVFNALDNEVAQAVYDNLVSAGMKGRKPIGNKPNYLYLYCIDGKLPNGFVY